MHCSASVEVSVLVIFGICFVFAALRCLDWSHLATSSWWCWKVRRTKEQQTKHGTKVGHRSALSFSSAIHLSLYVTMEPMFVFTKMVDTVDFPPDLRPRTILRHFNSLAQRTGSETESDIINSGIRAAKTSIKISRTLHEVLGWGEPTLTR